MVSQLFNSHLIALFTFYNRMIYSNCEGDVLHVYIAIQQLSNAFGLNIYLI